MDIEHKRNLKKLADFLEANVSEERFDMSQYVMNVDKRQDYEVLHDDDLRDAIDGGSKDYGCGTVACVLGYAPLALDLSYDECVIDGIFNERLFSWDKVSYDNFGLSGNKGDYDPSFWKWLFDADWHHYDPSLSGAIRRIRYYIRNGRPPKKFVEDGFDAFEWGHMKSWLGEGVDLDGWILR